MALLAAGACHDYNHDGFTNAYHANSMTERAIRYHDQSIQENHHAAMSFQLLMQDKNNFMADMSLDDVKTFRKRFVGAILASDMAKHTLDLDQFKKRLAIKGITADKNNGNLFLD